MENFKERFDSVVARTLCVKPERILPRAKFEEDLGADSLSMVELIVDLENEFQVVINDTDIEQITTVAEAEAYLWELVKQRNNLLLYHRQTAVAAM